MIPLVWYERARDLPPGAGQTLTRWREQAEALEAELAKLGPAVIRIPFDPADYARWRAESGLADDLAARDAWAGQTYVRWRTDLAASVEPKTPAGRVQIALALHLLGLTQAEFARALGTNQPTVARWETGTNEPEPASRAKLAALLRGQIAIE